MMPAIVDVSGLNRVSRAMFTNAGGAIGGMVTARSSPSPASSENPLIVASMFGNTTAYVTEAKKTALLFWMGPPVLVTGLCRPAPNSRCG